MKDSISVRPIINKKNGQCVINLPRKKMSKKFKEDLFNIKKMRIKVEDWEPW